MRIPMNKLSILPFIAFSATPAQALVVDGFDVAYSQAVSTGTYVDTQDDPSLFFGERDIGIEILSNTSGGSVHVDIAAGRITIRNDEGVGSYVKLQYDGVGEEAGNTGPGHTLIAGILPTGTFWEGKNHSSAFFVDDAQYTGFISLRTVVFLDGVLRWESSDNPHMGGPQVVTNALGWGPMRRGNAINLEFYMPNGGSTITVDHIDLVPEPSAFVLPGFLLALYGIRRKSVK